MRSSFSKGASRLCLGRVQLFQALGRKVFAKRVFHVLFREEHGHVFEVSVIGCHCEITQPFHDVHTLAGHVLLGEYSSQLLGAIVSEVDEDDCVSFFDGAICLGVVNRLDKLVGHLFSVTTLHSPDHVVSLVALSLHKQVVSLFHTVPTLVAIHGVEATHDACDGGSVGVAMFLQPLDKARATLGVCVASVHEAVHKNVAQAIFLAYLDQLEQVVKAGVHAAIGGQAHEMELLAALLGVCVSLDDALVFQYVAVLTCLVYLDQVLVHHPACANIEVSNLRVAHLSVGQSHVFAAGFKLGMRARGVEIVQVRCWSVVNNITFTMFADSPSIENHQKSLLTHNYIYLRYYKFFINTLLHAKLPPFRLLAKISVEKQLLPCCKSSICIGNILCVF